MTGGLLAGVSGMSDAVAGFRAAIAGGFTFSEEGAAALVSAIDHMLDGTQDALNDAERLKQEPPLGTTPAAQVYKPFLASIATEPTQGFIPIMTKFENDLKQLRAEVGQAVTTYQDNEQNVSQGFNAAGAPLIA